MLGVGAFRRTLAKERLVIRRVAHKKSIEDRSVAYFPFMESPNGKALKTGGNKCRFLHSFQTRVSNDL